MGAWNEFKCGSCEYRVEVSGGDDLGFSVRTTTIFCEDCEHLYDVVVFRGSGGVMSRGKPTGTIEPECPESSEHTFRRWKHPDVCPKCKNEMTLGKLIAIWD